MGTAKHILFICLSLIFITAGYPGQIKYFKLDKIVTLTGKIVSIEDDSSESHQGQFVVILMRDKTNNLYYLEVSPKWFFRVDLLEGAEIKVKGALNVINKKNILLIQSITHQGEIYHFRDQRGFPLWRGRNQRDKRQRGQQGKRIKKGKF